MSDSPISPRSLAADADAALAAAQLAPSDFPFACAQCAAGLHDRLARSELPDADPMPETPRN